MSQPIPADCVALCDYERHAHAALDPARWAYLAGGAGDELTLARNLADWSAEPQIPRVLAAHPPASTTLELLGFRLPGPWLIAPTASHGLFHPEAERATAVAAAALGTPLIISTQANLPLPTIVAAAQSAPCWFQLYFQPTRAATETLLRRAEDAGCQALVVTVDAPVHGIRNREARSGFRMPPGLEAAALRDLPAHPQVSSVLDPRFRAGLPSWADIAWLRAQTRLPLILKGILHPNDALLALENGCDAVVVSNHGGRTLDGVISTARALPAVSAALAGRLPVLVDGGIRRGTDILRARQLGATAVLLGRPILHGLAVAGAAGVAHVLEILRHEFEVSVFLSGYETSTESPPVAQN